MANPVAIQCSACLATLRVPEDKLGKKIRCPKCAEVFVAEAAEADDFEVEEEEAQPRSRGKGPVKKGGKKSQGSGLLIAGIAGGVVALGAVIGLVIFLMGAGDDGPIAPAPQVAAAPAMPMPPAGAMAGHGGAALPPGAPPAGAHGGATPAATAAGLPMPPVAATAAAPIAPTSSPATAPAAEFVSQSSSGPAQIDLSWIPADTETVIHIRPAAIWAAPALQQAVTHPYALLGVGQLQAMTGLTVADIESLTLAMKTPRTPAAVAATDPSLPEGVRQMPSPQAMTPEMYQPVLVARLKKPIFETVWERPDFPLQIQQYAGKTLRVFSQPGPDGKPLSVGIYQPDEQTIVAGLQDSVQKLIDSNGQARLFADWAPFDPNLQVQVGMRIKGFADYFKQSREMRAKYGAASPPEQQRAEMAMEQHLRAMAGGLQITDGLELAAKLQADNDAGGKEISDAIQAQQVAGSGDFLAQIETATGPLPQEAKTLIQTLHEESKNNVAGAVTSYTTRIPADKLGLLVQLAQKSQQAQMAGMLLGGPPGMSPGGMGSGLAMSPGERTGQTDPVATQNSDALPEKLELQASTLWDAPNLENGTVPLLIQFHLTATDDSLLCAAGEFEFRPPTTDAGKILANLPPRQTTLAGGEQILRTYVVPLNPDADDPQSLKFHIAFRSPAEARELRVCEGKFKVTRAGARTEVQLPLKKPIPAKLELSQELQKAGLSVKLERTKSGSHAGSEELVVSTGTSAVVGQLQILADADGDAPAGWETPVVKFVRDKAGMAQRLSSVDGEELPSEFVLKFVLYTDTETVDVPFDFAGLELPAAVIQPMTGAAPGFPGGSLPPGAFPGAPPQPPAGFPGSPAGPALPVPPEGRPVPRQN